MQMGMGVLDADNGMPPLGRRKHTLATSGEVSCKSTRTGTSTPVWILSKRSGSKCGRDKVFAFESMLSPPVE